MLLAPPPTHVTELHTCPALQSHFMHACHSRPVGHHHITTREITISRDSSEARSWQTQVSLSGDCHRLTTNNTENHNTPNNTWLGPGGRGPPPPPAARQALQPKVKLRPFFWSKLPANKDNIWARVQPPSAHLELGQMAALEQLFAQAPTTITPGRKKGADGKHAPLLQMYCSTHKTRVGVH